MKTQLNPDQGWESLRAAAEKIYKENGDKMVVLFWRKKYELVTADKDEVRWYTGFIDEEAAALFMDTDGDGLKYYNLIIDPLLRVQIVKTTFLNGRWQAERKRINEKLVTIL